ncbi:MAG TPA: hypothetical protein VLF14_01545, partial [Candidatus Binatia bacterium]|nr:hypothetical protein [Candidatus Binatia bacterium]
RPPGYEQMEELGRRLIASGSPPSEVAEKVFEAIRAERFYILPHPEWKDGIETRMRDILDERNPTPVDVQALLARLMSSARTA